jgi:hypothetical protein
MKRMTKPSNFAAIEKTTGKTWEEWVKYLEGIGAKDLPHKDIANHVRNKLKATQENAGWWAQSITVAYEQYIGRRKPGQRSDGTYEVSVTKTRPGTMEDAMKVWLFLIQGKDEFSGIAITIPPTISQTDKRLHWVCGLADGSRVRADTSESSGKVRLAITHGKLTDQKAMEKWRAYWKTLLAKV